jgi:hypothetical protein
LTDAAKPAEVRRRQDFGDVDADVAHAGRILGLSAR